MRTPYYDEKYEDDSFYWGKNPSTLCNKVIEIIKFNLKNRPKLIDLACGEGRDAIYFAKNNFDVWCLDVSLSGLRKTQKYAEEAGVTVRTIHEDILSFELTETFDVIYSSGSLQYIPPNLREKIFHNYKANTLINGLNAHTTLLEKLFIPKAPDAEENEYFFKSGEIMRYYWDWEILYISEEIIDCSSSGISHKHALNRIIARKFDEN